MKNKLLLTIASCIALCYQGLGAASEDVSAIVVANPSAWKAVTETLADPEVFSAIMLAKTAATIAIGGAVLWYGDRVRDSAASAMQFRQWNKVLEKLRKKPNRFAQYAREQGLLTDQKLKELADFKNNIVSKVPVSHRSNEVGMSAFLQKIQYQAATRLTSTYVEEVDEFFTALAVEILPSPTGLFARKVMDAARWLIEHMKFSSLMGAFLSIEHSLVETVGGMKQQIDNLECVLLRLKTCEGVNQCLVDVQKNMQQVCAMGSDVDVEVHSQSTLKRMIAMLVEQKKALQHAVEALEEHEQRGDDLTVVQEISMLRGKAQKQLNNVQAALRELISMSEKST